MGPDKSLVTSSYIDYFCPTKLYSTIYICMASILLKTKTKKPLWNNYSPVVAGKLKTVYQLEFACSKPTMKTPEKCVKVC